MGLFEFKDLYNPVPDIMTDQGETNYLDNASIVAQPGDPLLLVLGEIMPKCTRWIISHGRWSSHQLIEYIIQQTGKAEVTLTSWGISENPLRSILKMRDTEKISQLRCLLADRVRTECPKAYQLLAGSGVNFRLTKIHAKIILIGNENWHFTIFTSANLNRNNKIETYVVCEDEDLYNYNFNWITQQINRNG